MNPRNHIKIKVCGMTQMAQVHQLVTLGVDYAGFIFYEKSPRHVAGKIQPEDLKHLTNINKVGVFVNADLEAIFRIVDDYGLDYAQLHGDESPDICRKISAYVKVIKAFRLAGDEDLMSVLKDYPGVVDKYLFDAKAAEYGGTGKKFNWRILQNVKIDKPFFLSGGIGPQNAIALKDLIRDNVYNNLYALDINSKFEVMPGVKDFDLLECFISNFKK